MFNLLQTKKKMVEQNKKILKSLQTNNQKLNENSKEISQEIVESDKGQVKKFITIYKDILKYIKNIQWAPLNIPLSRRLETLAAALYVFVFLGLPFVCMIFAVLLTVSFLKIFIN